MTSTEAVVPQRTVEMVDEGTAGVWRHLAVVNNSSRTLRQTNLRRWRDVTGEFRRRLVVMVTRRTLEPVFAVVDSDWLHTRARHTTAGIGGSLVGEVGQAPGWGGGRRSQILILDLRWMDTDVPPRIPILKNERWPIKRDRQYFRRNFDKFRQLFIIIGIILHVLIGHFTIFQSVTRIVRMIHADNNEKLSKFVNRVTAKILSVPFFRTRCRTGHPYGRDFWILVRCSDGPLLWQCNWNTVHCSFGMEYRKALFTLADLPDDNNMCRFVGRHFCLTTNQWVYMNRV